MKYRKIGLLALIPALALVLVGVNARPPAAHASITKLLTITTTNCVLLAGNVDWNDSGTIDQTDGNEGLTICEDLDHRIGDLARVLGGDPNSPQPSDFAKVDMDAGQILQSDQPPSNPDPSSSVFILAFVTNDDPVAFYADNGVFVESTRNGAQSPSSQTFCGPSSDPTQDYSLPDCSRGEQTPTIGVVLAEWIPFGAERGPGTFTVRQGGEQSTIDYQVVGQAQHISLKAFDTAIQTHAPLCVLFSDTPSFLATVTEPETSPIVATVTDADGTSIAGALVEFSVSDSDMASLAIPDPLRIAFAPSLDLQALGVGAPAVICGGDKTGTVKVTATITTGKDVLPTNLSIEPSADKGLNCAATSGFSFEPPELKNACGPSASISLPVQSDPVAMSLAAVPPSLVCDGTATSTVTANLTDEASKAVVNGDLVHYDVQTLGSLNPIDARSSAGAATTVLTPLSGLANGVLVHATWMRHVVHGPTPTPVFTPMPLTNPFPEIPTPVFTPKAIKLEFVPSGLEQSMLVNCEQNPATVGELPGGAPAGAPGAVIAPPRTGSGGGEASPWLVALPLSAFALLLVGSGLALRRRKA